MRTFHSSLIFGENDTNIVNEIHAKAKHADIKDIRYGLSSQLKCLSERDAYIN